MNVHEPIIIVRRIGEFEVWAKPQRVGVKDRLFYEEYHQILVATCQRLNHAQALVTALDRSVTSRG